MSRPSSGELKQLGASLREIDPSHLAPDESGLTVRWYQGDGSTELYAWTTKDGALDHAQLVFFKVAVEWSVTRGLSTGTFKIGNTTAGGRYDPYLIAQAGRADPEVCGAALEVLEASSVDQTLSAPLAAALRTAVAQP